VPSFADRLDALLEVAGLGALKVDIAYGGDSFVMSTRRRSASRFVRMKCATSRRRAFALSLPPMISLVSRIPRAPAGTTSPSVSSPGRSPAREMNLRVRTPSSSVPVRLTARRQALAAALAWALGARAGSWGRVTSIAPTRLSGRSSSAGSRAQPRLAAGHHPGRF
jgi:hypothetical protein